MICRANKEDIPGLARLAIQMWSDNTIESLSEMFDEIISSMECAIFLLKKEERVCGFAQCQLRHDYVEGTDSSPVGYLEGIFIEEAYRKQGNAKALLAELLEMAE